MRFYSQASCLRDTHIRLFSRGIEIQEHQDQHYYCRGPIRYTLEDLLLEVHLDVALTERRHGIGNRALSGKISGRPVAHSQILHQSALSDRLNLNAGIHLVMVSLGIDA